MSKYYIYRHLNINDKIIYVGKTINLTARQRTYLSRNAHTCEDHCDEISRIEYINVNSKIEMDILELYYINTWKPKYNQQNKIDNENISLNFNNQYEWVEFMDKNHEYVLEIENEIRKMKCENEELKKENLLLKKIQEEQAFILDKDFTPIFEFSDLTENHSACHVGFNDMLKIYGSYNKYDLSFQFKRTENGNRKMHYVIFKNPKDRLIYINDVLKDIMLFYVDEDYYISKFKAKDKFKGVIAKDSLMWELYHSNTITHEEHENWRALYMDFENTYYLPYATFVPCDVKAYNIYKLLTKSNEWQKNFDKCMNNFKI